MSAPSLRRTGSLSLAITAALLSLLPILWTVSSSFRPATDIFRYLSPLSVRSFVPSQVTLDNYRALLSGPFLQATVNSLLVAVVTVIIGLAICASAAFALSVIDFPGRSWIFGLVVVSFLVPFDAIAIPLASTFRDVGLADSYLALILPGLGNGLAVFLLRQFFLGLPKELVEAAELDGMGWWRILWHIYVPLSRPALVSAGLILFIFQWQAFLWPLLITTSPEKDLAATSLAKLSGQTGVDYGQLFAGTAVITIVPILLLLIFQRQFTQSLANTGGK